MTPNTLHLGSAALLALTLAAIGCHNPYEEANQAAEGSVQALEEEALPTPTEACEHVLEIMSTADDSFEELPEEEQEQVMVECDADMTRLREGCGDQYEVMLQCILDVETPAEGSQGTAFYEAMAAVGACGEICESEAAESE